MQTTLNHVMVFENYWLRNSMQFQMYVLPLGTAAADADATKKRQSVHFILEPRINYEVFMFDYFIYNLD